MSLKDFTDAMEKVHTTEPVKLKLYARSALEEKVFKEMCPGIEVIRMKYYDEFERAGFTETECAQLKEISEKYNIEPQRLVSLVNDLYDMPCTSFGMDIEKLIPIARSDVDASELRNDSIEPQRLISLIDEMHLIDKKGE